MKRLFLIVFAFTLLSSCGVEAKRELAVRKYYNSEATEVVYLGRNASNASIYLITKTDSFAELCYVRATFGGNRATVYYVMLFDKRK